MFLPVFLDNVTLFLMFVTILVIVPGAILGYTIISRIWKNPPMWAIYYGSLGVGGVTIGMFLVTARDIFSALFVN